jgi:hypothetical protein
MELLAPWGGAGVLWLPANTPESRAHALEVVYSSPDIPRSTHRARRKIRSKK